MMQFADAGKINICAQIFSLKCDRCDNAIYNFDKTHKTNATYKFIYIFLFIFLFSAGKHPSGNVSQPDGTFIHPEEVDSGVIACVIIAIAIVSVLILGTVSYNLLKNLRFSFNFIMYFKLILL